MESAMSSPYTVTHGLFRRDSNQGTGMLPQGLY